MRMTPILSRLDEVLLRHVFGERDPQISYEWAPLWQASDDEKATTSLKKAQAHKIDVDAGLISPDALRKGRENMLIEDGFYPGFEAALSDAEAAASEDVPEEAMPPHPALREKLSAQEIAQQRFEQQQQASGEQHKEKLAVMKAKPSFFGKPANGGGNGKAKPNASNA
jgi:hypothetical protein